MVSNDPVESAAKGTVKGVLEWSTEQVKELVRRFNQRELSFIEDRETIEQVIAQRKKPEFLLYLKYVKDKDLRIQIEMGFHLKKITGNPIKLQNLRNKILRKYKTNGLHVAELSQTGIFSRYVGLLLEKTENETELIEGIEGILYDIEKHVLFVKSDSNIKEEAGIIVNKIQLNLPRAIVIFSKGNAAKKKANGIINIIKKQIQSRGYRIETQNEEETNQQYHFILKTSVTFLNEEFKG